MSSKKKAANGGSTPPEVPIFLQKTYHMIDTCPPQIATWSSDGLTFIVKNTHLFETTIIPQFFKHSKFSSFVRQLNFYGFRKIRFENSLKIDLQKEREQRNFWRFKHECFRRGRKDLLREIKRSASSSSSSSSSAANNNAAVGGNGGAVTAAVSPNAIMSNSSVATNSPSPNNTTTNTTQSPPQEVTRLNTEVTVLKEQMQSMATKMEDLTSLVKTMNVSPQQEVMGGEGCGNKRKKTDTMMTMMTPEGVPSMMMGGGGESAQEVDVDVIMSFPDGNMSLEDAATTLLPDLTLSNPSSAGPSSLIPTPVLSRCSSIRGMDVAPTAAADVGGGGEDFVDELFHAFATDDSSTEELQQHELFQPAPLLPSQQQQQQVVENPNKPDPQLMKRIEDSLSTIPKTMHEMVANRLIDAIAEGNTSSGPGSSSCGGEGGATIVRSPSSSSSVSSPNKQPVATTDKENALNMSSSSSSIIPESVTATTAEAEKTTIPLPLAIATLKTILADYGLKVECGSSSEDAMVHRRLSNKSLPMVPMHA